MKRPSEHVIDQYVTGAICSDLGILQHSIHENAIEKGFYDGVNLASEEPSKELVASLVANIHGEVSELWESFRKGTLNEPCDKAEAMSEMALLPLTCAEEELADIVIRALDSAGALGINLGEAIIAKHNYNTTRSHRHGGKKA